VQGQLGDRLIPDLIREISEKASSGLLRVSRGKAIKAIFFDKGAPVFAISNLGSEQLDRKLIDQGLASNDQLQQARQRADKPHKLGSVLVEMRVLNDADMRRIVREQVMEIILSLFEWTNGEYILDEKIRAAHDVTLDISTADMLLEGARRAAANDQVAAALAPPDGVISRTRGGFRVDSGRLIPLESYVLSRIESPTAVSEVGGLIGLPEDEAHRAVCALVAAGFLRLEGDDRNPNDAQNRETEEQLQRLREEINRKLHFFVSADYYEILGVGRQATTSDIKAAYYQLAKKFHPDRYRQLEQGELRSQLETLFGMIATAYDTLIEPPRRAAYDDRIRKAPASAGVGSIKTTPLVHSEPPKPIISEKPAGTSGPLFHDSPAPEYQAAGASAGAGEASFHVSADPIAADAAPKAGVPTLNAEQLFQQGRARFERKEYHAAVHLFREAIKQDPSRAPYHFHLGMALVRNPRTRREAEYHLGEAAKLDPYSSQMRLKLGVLYKEMGLAKKAEVHFKEALRLDPENKAAQREIGALRQAGKEDGHSLWKSDLGSIAKKIFKK
jgi:curved DNA-binding protein CbpA